MGHNIHQSEREPCSKMPMIMFSYFDIEAKGELTRLLLHAGNFDFEDDRLPISSWPGEHKEKTLVEDYLGEFLPKWLESLERLLKKRGGGWFAGSSATFARCSCLEGKETCFWRILRMSI